MRKKIVMLLVGLLSATATFAQFEQDKIYFSAGASNLNLGYTGCEKFSADLQLKGGYLFQDNWMALANLGYGYHKYSPNTFSLGAGLRYYIEQNGIYLGVGVDYKHANHNYDDFMPNVNIGYAFFLSRTVTVEPELYYNQSFKNHSDYSGAGLRVNFGIYLFTDGRQ